MKNISSIISKWSYHLLKIFLFFKDRYIQKCRKNINLSKYHTCIYIILDINNSMYKRIRETSKVLLTLRHKMLSSYRHDRVTPLRRACDPP